MTEIISILLPTRERPQQLKRFLESLDRNTSDKQNLEIILYIDEDDFSYENLNIPALNIVKIIGKKLSMGGYNTACLKKAAGEIIVLLNDDVVVQTNNWDAKIRKFHRKYPDGIYLAYGNDLYKGKRISTFPILSKRFCEIMIQPFLEEYLGACIDLHTFDVFKRLEKMRHRRIFYMHNLIFEHMHYRTGKAKLDATYQRRSRFRDDEFFFKLSGFREEQANRLCCAIEGREFNNLTKTYTTYKNKNIFQAVFFLFKLLVFNGNLPLFWRAFLFCWSTGRNLAAFGYLKVFGYNRDCDEHSGGMPDSNQ